MAGRPKLKLYQYSAEGLYMRHYDTQMEVFAKYFDGKKGELFGNKEYRELPDGTFVSWYRIGKKGLARQIRIDNDIYCKHYKDDTPFDVFNILGEKIAHFNSVRTACNMTGLNYSSILKSLKEPGRGQISASPFKFRYSNEQEQRVEEPSTEKEVQETIEEPRFNYESRNGLERVSNDGVTL